ncbi:MAG: hypothetical protein MI923_20490 [Phycisphaerales bacterium]|nr:hypothetical protein [Phycisphaerales bacterium]
MENDSKNNGFLTRLLNEAEPIIFHAATVLMIELSLLVLGLMTSLLEKLFPAYKKYFEIMKLIDIWAAMFFLCMFALFTLFLVGLRLFKSLREEGFE